MAKPIENPGNNVVIENLRKEIVVLNDEITKLKSQLTREQVALDKVASFDPNNINERVQNYLTTPVVFSLSGLNDVIEFAKEVAMERDSNHEYVTILIGPYKGKKAKVLEVAMNAGARNGRWTVELADGTKLMYTGEEVRK